MRLFRSVIVALLIGIVLAPISARAGGWWNSIDLDSSSLAIGEKFTFRQQLAFADSGAAQRARGLNYGAYLMRDINQDLLDRAMSVPDPKRWWEPVPGMIRVGDVKILGSSSNWVRAAVRISLPEIGTGSYYLMLCDPGCRRPLADVVPTRVRVTAEPLAAEALRQVARYRAHTDMKILRLDRLARGARARAVALEAEVARMDAEMGALRTRLAASGEAPSNRWEPYVLGATAGTLLVLLGTLLASALRRRVGSPVGDIALEDIPDDARELTSVK